MDSQGNRQGNCTAQGSVVTVVSTWYDFATYYHEVCFRKHPLKFLLRNRNLGPLDPALSGILLGLLLLFIMKCVMHKICF